MPLNDYPSAKPTYDFNDTVNAGKTVLANGFLLGRQTHPPDAEFPARLGDLALGIPRPRWPATWSRTAWAAST